MAFPAGIWSFTKPDTFFAIYSPLRLPGVTRVELPLLFFFAVVAKAAAARWWVGFAPSDFERRHSERRLPRPLPQ